MGAGSSEMPTLSLQPWSLLPQAILPIQLEKCNYILFPFSSSFWLWGLAAAQRSKKAREGKTEDCICGVYVHAPSTPRVCTRGIWCVSMYARMFRGMKVNMSACTHVCEFICVYEGLLTALLIFLLQGPNEAQGCHLPWNPVH